MKHRDDTNLSGFDDVYFPDAYVLDIREGATEVSFELDVYARGRARLVFPNVTRVEWLNKVMQPTYGLDPEPDYGSIDSLTFHASRYRISGEWGELAIQSDVPIIVFLE